MALLDDEQVAFFRTFGFLIFRQLLGADEVETIAREAEVAIEEIYQGREGGYRGRWGTRSSARRPRSAPRCSRTRASTASRPTAVR